jgi:ubiquinone/menaquinone biosynthesis C-methylase UbiE
MTTEAIEKQRREIHEIAEAIVPGWERWRARIEEITAPVREWMIRQLAPRTGDSVLELAAGTGDTGFEAAAIVGDRGRLISTDFSPAMVEVARRRGAELGLGNVQHRVMDAERVELDADPVDGAADHRQRRRGAAIDSAGAQAGCCAQHDRALPGHRVGAHDVGHPPP